MTLRLGLGSGLVLVAAVVRVNHRPGHLGRIVETFDAGYPHLGAGHHTAFFPGRGKIVGCGKAFNLPVGSTMDQHGRLSARGTA